MKKQVLFSLKNNDKVFMNVVRCSGDWRFKAQKDLHLQSLRNVYFKLYYGKSSLELPQNIWN